MMGIWIRWAEVKSQCDLYAVLKVYIFPETYRSSLKDFK